MAHIPHVVLAAVTLGRVGQDAMAFVGLLLRVFIMLAGVRIVVSTLSRGNPQQAIIWAGIKAVLYVCLWIVVRWMLDRFIPGLL